VLLQHLKELVTALAGIALCLCRAVHTLFNGMVVHTVYMCTFTTTEMCENLLLLFHWGEVCARQDCPSQEHNSSV
jgi:hypothetical protein